MLPPADTRRLVDRILALVHATRGAEAFVSVTSARTGNTRFAVSEITSAGDIDSLSVSLEVRFGLRSASATINQLDDRSLDDLVSRVVQMARLAPENPEQMPVLGPQHYLPVREPVDADTSRLSPERLAKAVGAALAGAETAKVSLAGFVTHTSRSLAIATSAGLWAYHAATECNFSCTARTADGTGSGWAGAGSNRFADLDIPALAKVAVDKATASAQPRKLDPGRYTVVLEPAAVSSLLRYLAYSLDARRADEGRSFFSKHKPGEKLFSDAITLRTDPSDARIAGSPFDDEGHPLAATRWIDRGALTALIYTRYWAKQRGVPSTGRPDTWILDGGTATRDELIKGVQRGVLITRFWYLRAVDPQTLLVTGLTRDGVFLIENGQITHPVNNFRFNESPIQMLAKCDGLGSAVIPADGESGGGSSGMRVPVLRTHDFNLASISEAV